MFNPNPVPTGPPLSFQATPINSSAIQLTWDPPTTEQQNGIIQQYLINMTAMESGESYQLISPNTSLTVNDLHPYYHYNLLVAAVTTEAGPFSNILLVLMPEDGKSYLLSCN